MKVDNVGTADRIIQRSQRERGWDRERHAAPALEPVERANAPELDGAVMFDRRAAATVCRDPGDVMAGAAVPMGELLRNALDAATVRRHVVRDEADAGQVARV